LKSSGPTIFLQSGIASPSPFPTTKLLLVLYSSSYSQYRLLFRFYKKNRKGNNASSFGAKMPPAEEKVLVRYVGWGSSKEYFFLFEKKKRQVLARSLLLALELTSGMDAR
jgi:hypothetical protein